MFLFVEHQKSLIESWGCATRFARHASDVLSITCKDSACGGDQLDTKTKALVSNAEMYACIILQIQNPKLYTTVDVRMRR